MDELSQLDELIESDILDALGAEKNKDLNDDIITQDINEPVDRLQDVEKKDTSDSNNEIQKATLSNSNLEEISSLLSQLLNNKTIEITIKIKD